MTSSTFCTATASSKIGEMMITILHNKVLKCLMHIVAEAAFILPVCVRTIYIAKDDIYVIACGIHDSTV